MLVNVVVGRQVGGGGVRGGGGGGRLQLLGRDVKSASVDSLVPFPSLAQRVKKRVRREKKKGCSNPKSKKHLAGALGRACLSVGRELWNCFAEIQRQVTNTSINGKRVCLASGHASLSPSFYA